jgi:rhodanese-related sulfurtransferase
MIDQIQPAQLATWAASHAAQGTAVVLDVREPWEVQTACVTPQGFETADHPHEHRARQGCKTCRVNVPLPACATMAHVACKWPCFRPSKDLTPWPT